MTILAVLVLIVVARAVAPKQTNATAAATSLVYSTATAHYGNLSVNVSGSGVVEAASAIGVDASQTGTVTSVPVAVGSAVKAGQVLAYVKDQGALEGNLLSAKAQLAADEASLSALTPAAAQIKAQEQRVQADEDRVQSDQQSIADLTVVAPISGTISTVDVTPGQVVGAGAPLFEVVQTSSAEVEISVPQIDLPNISIGGGAQVWTLDLGYMQAVVTNIGLQSDGTSRIGALYPVTLRIENPPAGLRQGMQANVNFPAPYILTSSGTIAFADTDTVAAQVAGTVTTIAQQAGESVQSGQAVLTLQNPGLPGTLSADEAQLASDQAQLQQMQNPSPSQTASLKARIAADQETVSEAEKALQDLDIKSPISGLVTAVNVQQGSIVGPSLSQATAPFAVENPHSLEVSVPVPEISIAQVAIGQRATITADALPGQTFAGKVAEIAPAGAVSQGVATFDVTIDVTNTGALRAGMSANAVIDIARLHHVLLIPVESLAGYGHQTTVQVLSGGMPVIRHVTVGLSNDLEAEITGGLTPGTRVITAKASQGTLPFGSSSGGKSGGGS